jgi:Domain of unknown function (DUF5666)
MSAILHILAALLAALTATSGAPPVNASQFRAPISSAPVGINATQLVTSTITPKSSVEITGTISTITGTTISLSSGVTVTVGVTTEVKGNLEPGTVVQVEGSLQPDGSIIAFEINAGGIAGNTKEDPLDLDKDDKVITATLTLTRTNDIGEDKDITATETITHHRDMDEQGITQTLTLTNTKGIDDKHKSHNGDDWNKSQGGDTNSHSGDNGGNPVIIGNINNSQSKHDDNSYQPSNVSNNTSPSQGNYAGGGDHQSQNTQYQSDHPGGD